MQFKTPVRKKDWPYMLLFPSVIFYFEIIFRISTVGLKIDISYLYMLLFSVSFGAIGYLLSSIFKKEKANYYITLVLLLVTAVLYLVFYFVYKQFKQDMGLETIIGGAGGVLTDFQDEIKVLILNFDGISKIVLYFVPFFAFMYFGRKQLRPEGSTALLRGIAAGAMVVLFSISFLLVSLFGHFNLYKKEFNFLTASGKFGLLTAVRIDAQNIIFGKDDGGFESAPTDTPPAADDEPLVYKDNVMNLDFSKPCSSSIKELNDYVQSLTPSKQNEMTGIFKGKNLILITAEAFSAEVISPELTPTLYRLANKGIKFTDYYQPASAGTTGGEYQNIFGMIPTAGGKSFKNTSDNLNYFTMGHQLNRLGYYGQAFHNNSYTFYQRNETHVNLGYSEGFMGYGNGMEQYVQNVWPQSDLEMLEGTLPTYIDKQPFSVYYMTVSGHSNYTLAGNKMTAKNWERVSHLNYSSNVKGYIAANLELEDAMAHLVSELEAKGIADDTVICISSDHFPYGLDFSEVSELYGYKVNKNSFELDHSALIMWCGSLEKEEPIVVDEPTSSLDILPTLSNLFGTQHDSRLMPGRDVFSDTDALVFNASYGWKTELGTYTASTGFVPKSVDTVIPEGYVQSIKVTVRNKMRFCSGVLDNDYYRYLFG